MKELTDARRLFLLSSLKQLSALETLFDKQLHIATEELDRYQSLVEEEEDVYDAYQIRSPSHNTLNFAKAMESTLQNRMKFFDYLGEIAEAEDKGIEEKLEELSGFLNLGEEKMEFYKEVAEEL